MKSLLAIILMVYFAGQASAEGHGVYTVIGVGGNKCSTYLEEYYTKDTATKYKYKQWLMGYVTAINHKAAMENLAYDGESNSKLGAGKAGAFLEALYYYCKANPQQYFNDGAKYLVKQLEIVSQ